MSLCAESCMDILENNWGVRISIKNNNQIWLTDINGMSKNLGLFYT